MSSLINYFKDIEFFSNKDRNIDHSNEFSIRSEDCNICECKNIKPKVKFNEDCTNTNTINDKSTIFMYIDNVKHSIVDYYGVLTTIILVLVMTLKIIFINFNFY